MALDEERREGSTTAVGAEGVGMERAVLADGSTAAVSDPTSPPPVAPAPSPSVLSLAQAPAQDGPRPAQAPQVQTADAPAQSPQGAQDPASPVQAGSPSQGAAPSAPSSEVRSAPPGAPQVASAPAPSSSSRSSAPLAAGAPASEAAASQDAPSPSPAPARAEAPVQSHEPPPAAEVPPPPPPFPSPAPAPAPSVVHPQPAPAPAPAPSAPAAPAYAGPSFAQAIQDVSGRTNAASSGSASAQDPDAGASVSYSLGQAPPAHGQVSVHADGTFDYTPASGYAGTDSFQIQAADAHGNTASQTVRIAVAADAAPSVQAITLSGLEGSSASGTLSVSDPSGHGDAMAFEIVGPPSHGTISVDASGHLSYVPSSAGFFGQDSAVVRIDDGHGGRTDQTVSISVAQVFEGPSFAVGPGDASHASQSVSARENASVSGSAQAQDSDPGVSPVYALGASHPAHGQAVVHADGTFDYAPDSAFAGLDAFEISVSDGHGNSAVQTVHVSVAPDGALSVSGPVALASVVSGASRAFSASELLANAQDAEGDALSIAFLSASHGTITDNGDGTYTFQAQANWHGAAGISYSIDDGHGDVVQTSASLTVASAGAPSQSAEPDLGSFSHGGGARTFTAAELLAGTSDPDGLALSITSISADHGSVVLNGDQSATWTPDPSRVGSVSFSLDVSNTNGDFTTILAVLHETNAAPAGSAITASDSLATAHGAFATITDAEILAAASDADGDSLSVSGLSGTGTITRVAGGWEVSEADHSSGTKDFTATISDGRGGTTTEAVHLATTAGNTAPSVAATGSVSVREGTTYSGSVSATDAEGDSIAYSLSGGQPSHGTVAVAADGSYTLQEGTGWDGDVSFAVQASDGHGGTSVQTITAHVAADAAPTTAALSLSGTENTTLTGTFSASDASGHGDAMSYSVAAGGQSAHGTASVDAASGAVSFAPSGGWTGTTSITLQADNGHGGVSTEVVSIEVDAAAAPVQGSVPSLGAILHGAGTQVFSAASLLAGTSDPGGFALSLSSVSADHGTAALVGGNVHWTPDPTYDGSVSFTLVADDGRGGTATITATASETDTAPTGSAITASDTLATAHGAYATITDAEILSAASDADGDSLSVSGLSGTGTITRVAGGWEVSEADHSSGTKDFTATISDGHGATATETVHLATTAGNTVPSVSDASVSGRMGVALSGAVGASDAEGDALSYSVSQAAGHGSASVDASGNWSYAPSAAWHGADSFQITVSDGHGGSSSKTFTVATTTDAAPTDAPLSLSGTENTTLTGTFSASDASGNGDAMSYSVVSQSAHGTTVVDASSGAVSFAPSSGWTGTTSITLRADNGHGGTTDEVVSVEVDAAAAPVQSSSPDLGSFAHSAAAQTFSAASILAGTSDPGGFAMRLTSVSADHGAAVLNGNGTITWTPSDAYASGPVSFTFVADDGHGGTATITATASETNAAPAGSAITASDSLATAHGAFATITDAEILAAASDADGDSLSVSGLTGTGTITRVAGGWRVEEADHSSGTKDFTATISDGHGGTTTETVHLATTAGNTAPSVAATDSISVREGTTHSGSVSATDAEGDSLSYSLSGGQPTHGTVAVAADGSYTLQEGTGWAGDVSFAVQASDGHGGTSVQTITAHVAADAAPTPAALSLSGTENTTLAGTFSASDASGHGDVMAYSVAAGGQSAHGTASVDAASGVVSFAPSGGWTGTTSITLQADNGHGGVSTEVVSVEVDAAPSPVQGSIPSLGSVSHAAGAQSFSAAAVLSGTADPDGYALALSSVSADHGTATLVGGAVHWSPDASYAGAVAFTVGVDDGHGGTATITATALETNAAPVSSGTVVLSAVSENGVRHVAKSLLGSDVADADGDALTFSDLSAGHGTLLWNSGTSKFDYTPTHGWFGADTLTFTATDAFGASTTGRASITVNQVFSGPSFGGGTSTALDAAIQTVSVRPADALSGQTTADDSDPGVSLSYSVASQASQGSVALNADGTWVYGESSPDWSGSDSFVVVADDGHGHSATQVVSVQVSPDGAVSVSGPVVLGSFAAQGAGETITAAQLLAAATDSHGESMAISGVSVSGGSLADNGDGTWTLTSATAGTATVSYTVSDAHGNHVAASAAASVSAAPAAPSQTAPMPNLAVLFGQHFSFDLSQDVSGATSYALSGAPGWMSVDSATGIVSGTMNSATPTTAVTLRAINATGETDLVFHVSQANNEYIGGFSGARNNILFTDSQLNLSLMDAADGTMGDLGVGAWNGTFYVPGGQGGVENGVWIYNSGSAQYQWYVSGVGVSAAGYNSIIGDNGWVRNTVSDVLSATTTAWTGAWNCGGNPGWAGFGANPGYSSADLGSLTAVWQGWQWGTQNGPDWFYNWEGNGQWTLRTNGLDATGVNGGVYSGEIAALSSGQVLFGTSGNDTLASLGTTTLVGNGGTDVFVVRAMTGGVATITDWTAGDTLVVQGYSESALREIDGVGGVHVQGHSASGWTDVAVLAGKTVAGVGALSSHLAPITCVSTDALGWASVGNATISVPTLSGDGSLLSYTSDNWASLYGNAAAQAAQEGANVQGRMNPWQNFLVGGGSESLLSQNSAGAVSNANSWVPYLDTSGTFVAYDTNATNFDGSREGGGQDAVVMNLSTGAATFLSAWNGGGLSDWFDVQGLTDDGTHVWLVGGSDSNNVVQGFSTTSDQIYEIEVAGGSFRGLVSCAQDGTISNGGASYSARATLDGRFVVFDSDATNLTSVNGFTNTADAGKINMYVKDMQTGALYLANASADGTPGNGPVEGYVSSISDDGTRVVFSSSATNLVAGADNGNFHAYVKNIATGAIVDLTAGWNASAPNGWTLSAWDSSLSGDGDLAAFKAIVPTLHGLTTDGSSGYADIWLERISTGQRVLVTQGADGDNWAPTLSNDGSTLAWLSNADNLSPGTQGLRGQATDPNQVQREVLEANTARLLADAPVFTSSLSASALAGGTTTGVLAASDAALDAMSYSVLSGPAHGTFSLDASTGAWSYVSSGGWGGTDAVLVEAFNGHSACVVKTLSLDVSSQAPVITAGAASLTQMSAYGTAVAHLSASDPNGLPITWSLDDSAGGLFAINASTGEIDVADGASATNLAGYDLVARATDSLHGTSVQAVHVSVVPQPIHIVGAGVQTLAQQGAHLTYGQTLGTNGAFGDNGYFGKISVVGASFDIGTTWSGGPSAADGTWLNVGLRNYYTGALVGQNSATAALDLRSGTGTHGWNALAYMGTLTDASAIVGGVVQHDVRLVLTGWSSSLDPAPAGEIVLLLHAGLNLNTTQNLNSGWQRMDFEGTGWHADTLSLGPTNQLALAGATASGVLSATDSTGAALSWTGMDGTSHVFGSADGGTVVLLDDGAWSYTSPAGMAMGMDSFQVVAHDSLGNSVQQTVSIDVLPSNAALIPDFSDINYLTGHVALVGMTAAPPSDGSINAANDSWINVRENGDAHSALVQMIFRGSWGAHLFEGSIEDASGIVGGVLLHDESLTLTSNAGWCDGFESGTIQIVLVAGTDLNQCVANGNFGDGWQRFHMSSTDGSALVAANAQAVGRAFAVGNGGDATGTGGGDSFQGLGASATVHFTGSNETAAVSQGHALTITDFNALAAHEILVSGFADASVVDLQDGIHIQGNGADLAILAGVHDVAMGGSLTDQAAHDWMVSHHVLVSHA